MKASVQSVLALSKSTLFLEKEATEVDVLHCNQDSRLGPRSLQCNQGSRLGIRRISRMRASIRDYLQESVYAVVLHTPISAQIRQLILHRDEHEG